VGASKNEAVEGLRIPGEGIDVVEIEEKRGAEAVLRT